MYNKEVLELWEKGLTDKEISIKLNLLRRRVSRIRLNLNLVSNNPDRVILDINEIEELIKSKSASQIAIIKNCSRETICRFLRKNNLKYLYNDGKNSKDVDKTNFTEDQISIIIGCVLGDGWLIKMKNTYFSCKHGPKQKDYCYWKYSYFQNMNAKFTYGIRKNPDIRTNIRYESYELRTPCNTNYNLFYDLFYINNKKVLTPEILNLYTELSLAVHYMDDGTKLEGSYQICTDCFTIEEINLFRDFLLKKWNIETTIQNKSNRVYIRRKSKEIFENLIKPYIHETMKYKLYCSL